MSSTIIPIIPNEKSSRSMSEFEYIDPNSDATKLGKGSFATVQLAREKRTAALVAVKKINVSMTSASKSEIHNLQTEIKVHRELSHPNIIKFHDYIQEPSALYIILDYAPNGNLYGFMNKKKTLPSDQIFRFFYQACLAVQYLHQKDILHRDLKPENLLLDNDLNLKLCDFGWAARSIRDKRTTFCGTYEYMAPEIVEKRQYDYRVDIWSLGVLLYELSHGEAPYKGRSHAEITASFAKGAFQCKASTAPELQDLIRKILRINPNDRISLAEILSHPWVRKNIGQYGYTTSNGSSGYNANTVKTLEHVRSLERVPNTKLTQDLYNDSLDKENHNMKAFYSQKVKDEVARALINLGHAPDYMRKVDRVDASALPGLAYRELNQTRMLLEENMRKQSEYASVQLIKTVPERDMHAALDQVNGYVRRQKYVDSQNTTLDNSTIKSYSQQRTVDLLKKAHSSRSYYVKPTFLDKSLSHQPTIREQNYNSTPVVYANTPTSAELRSNYNSQVRGRAQPIGYVIKAGTPYQTEYNDEDQTQWRKPHFGLRTEAVKMGTERMYPYEAPAPVSSVSRPGLATLRTFPSIPYGQGRQDVGSRGDYSPFAGKVVGTWGPGTPSLLLNDRNERHMG